MAFFFSMTFMVCVFWRPQVWVFRWLYGTGYLDGVVFAMILALLMEVDAGKIKMPKKHQLVVLGGFYLATLMSHVGNTHLRMLILTIPHTIKYSLYMIVLLCVLDSAAKIRTVIYIFVLMAVMMTVHALLQESRGYGFFNHLPVIIHRGSPWEFVRTRFFGIFGDPNDLAQMLVVCIPLVFALPFRMNLFKWALCSALAYFIYLGLVSTHSRGGYIGLAAIVGGASVFIFPRRWTPVMMLLAILGALALCPAAGMVLDSSARTRVVYWGLANRRFKQNPLFGLGYGMFWQVTRENQAAHNAFVHCYTEIGYVGYWFWFGMALLGIVSCWRARVAIQDVDHPTAQYLSRASAACIVSMIGFCASGYFLSRAFIYPYFFLCVLLIAFSNVAEEYMDDAAKPIINVGRDVVFLITAGSFASIMYIYWSILLLNKAL